MLALLLVAVAFLAAGAFLVAEAVFFAAGAFLVAAALGLAAAAVVFLAVVLLAALLPAPSFTGPEGPMGVGKKPGQRVSDDGDMIRNRCSDLQDQSRCTRH